METIQQYVSNYYIYKLLKFLKSEDDFRLLIIGGIKTGKSALMYHLAEIWHKLFPNKKVFLVNFPEKYKKLLPSWITPINRYTVSDYENCLMLFEESSLVSPARRWYSTYNVKLSQLISISAHKRQRHIYVIQNTRLLDPNIIALMSAIAIKRYNYISYMMERKELKELISTSWIIYEENGIISDLDIKRHVVFFQITDYPFLYRYSLPSFWTEKLGRIWSVYSFRSQKIEMQESLTEKITQLIVNKNIKSYKELKQYFPNTKLSVLKTLYYRVKKRLAEQ